MEPLRHTIAAHLYKTEVDTLEALIMAPHSHRWFSLAVLRLAAALLNTNPRVSVVACLRTAVEVREAIAPA